MMMSSSSTMHMSDIVPYYTEKSEKSTRIFDKKKKKKYAVIVWSSTGWVAIPHESYIPCQQCAGCWDFQENGMKTETPAMTGGAVLLAVLFSTIGAEVGGYTTQEQVSQLISWSLLPCYGGFFISGLMWLRSRRQNGPIPL